MPPLQLGKKYKYFFQVKKVPFVWQPHSKDNENCVCLGQTKVARGRPKKRMAEQLKSDHDSDTNSAAEEEGEQESPESHVKKSLRQIVEEFSSQQQYKSTPLRR